MCRVEANINSVGTATISTEIISKFEHQIGPDFFTGGSYKLSHTRFRLTGVLASLFLFIRIKEIKMIPLIIEVLQLYHVLVNYLQVC